MGILLPLVFALLQEPGAEAPPRPAPAVAREERALLALQALEERYLRTPPPAEREAALAVLLRAREEMAALAAAWPGTAASFRARLHEATLDLRFLGRREEGLRLLEETWQEIEARGLRFPKVAGWNQAALGLDIAREWIRSGQPDRARPYLARVAAGGTPEAETARRLLQTLGRPRARPGDPWPVLRVAGPDGRDGELAPREDESLLLVATASWSRPAREVLRELARHPPEGVRIVAVVLDRAPDRARRQAEADGLPFPLVGPRDAEGRDLAGLLGLDRVPLLLLVGPDGRVRARAGSLKDLGEALPRAGEGD